MVEKKKAWFYSIHGVVTPNLGTAILKILLCIVVSIGIVFVQFVFYKMNLR